MTWTLPLMRLAQSSMNSIAHPASRPPTRQETTNLLSVSIPIHVAGENLESVILFGSAVAGDQAGCAENLITERYGWPFLSPWSFFGESQSDSGATAISLAGRNRRRR